MFKACPQGKKSTIKKPHKYYMLNTIWGNTDTNDAASELVPRSGFLESNLFQFHGRMTRYIHSKFSL